MFMILEFSLSQSFDIVTIETVKNIISKRNKETFEPIIEEILLTNQTMKKDLIGKANTLSKQNKLKTFLEELNSLKTGINKDYIEKSNSTINVALNKLKEVDCEGAEYYLLGDGVYIKD